MKKLVVQIKSFCSFFQEKTMDKILDIYSDYLIAQNQYATATGLSDLLEGQISHDKITRFLNSKQLSSKELVGIH